MKQQANCITPPSQQQAGPVPEENSNHTKANVIIIDGAKYQLSEDANDGRHTVLQGIEEKMFGKPVMIKIYRKDMNDKGVHESAMLEALHKLTEAKRYIVECKGFSAKAVYQEEQRAALVMEVGKKNLRQAAEKGTARGLLKKTIPTMKTIAECLDFLHSKAEMVHADLKLENVVTFDEDQWDWKLVDFENCTAMGAVMSMESTPEYCPPELAIQLESQQQGTLTACSSFDVWCFGVLWLKYLMRGGPLVEFQLCPGQYVPKDEIISRIAKPDFSFKESLKELQVSKPVEALIRSCTALDPAERPTFKQILRDDVVRGVGTTLYNWRKTQKLIEQGLCDPNELRKIPMEEQHPTESSESSSRPITVTSACDSSTEIGADEHTIHQPRFDQHQQEHLGPIISVEGSLYELDGQVLSGRNSVFTGRTTKPFSKPVAIKIYARHRDENGRKEASTLERLYHHTESTQFIVQAIDYSDETEYQGETRSVLVTECGKESLKHTLENVAQGELMVFFLPIMCQIAECMHFIHSTAQMVYAELKLENVVNFGGDLPQFKLIDFELSCAIDERISEICAVEYCPPELAVALDGDSLRAARSYDVWCFGVLLMKYFMRGRVLVEFQEDGVFDHASFDSIIRRIADPSFDFEQTLSQLDVSTPVKDLIRRCTARDPASRPTFEQILDELRIYLLMQR